MKNKTYFNIVSAVFIIVAVVHTARIMFDWQVQIGAWNVPVWASALAVLIAGVLAYQSFHRLKK